MKKSLIVRLKPRTLKRTVTFPTPFPSTDYFISLSVYHDGGVNMMAWATHKTTCGLRIRFPRRIPVKGITTLRVEAQR